MISRVFCMVPYVCPVFSMCSEYPVFPLLWLMSCICSLYLVLNFLPLLLSAHALLSECVYRAVAQKRLLFTQSLLGNKSICHSIKRHSKETVCGDTDWINLVQLWARGNTVPQEAENFPFSFSRRTMLHREI
jgi:hypothetical protein